MLSYHSRHGGGESSAGCAANDPTGPGRPATAAGRRLVTESLRAGRAMQAREPVKLYFDYKTLRVSRDGAGLRAAGRFAVELR